MLMWSLFVLLMTVMLVVDLRLNRTIHTASFKEALGWNAIWAGLAIVFNTGIYLTMRSGFHIPISISLSVFLATLIVAATASIIFGKRQQKESLEST